MDQSCLLSIPGPAGPVKSTGSLVPNGVPHPKVATCSAAVVGCWVSCSLSFSCTNSKKR